MPLKKQKPYQLILASQSPRRQFLLKEIGLKFKCRAKKVNESFPGRLRGKQIPIFLSKKKAAAFKKELSKNELLITADTIVWLNNRVLNKPRNYKEALNILKQLSAKKHTVYTGVCLTTQKRQKCFSVSSTVQFNKLSEKEIESYIKSKKPFDKAGAYGAQECLPANINPCSKEEKAFIKYIDNPKLFEKSLGKSDKSYSNGFIRKITGSYFNVMGFPIKEVYEEVDKICKQQSQ